MTDSAQLDQAETFGEPPTFAVYKALQDQRDELRQQLHDARNELMRIPLLEMQLEEMTQDRDEAARLYRENASELLVALTELDVQKRREAMWRPAPVISYPLTSEQRQRLSEVPICRVVRVQLHATPDQIVALANWWSPRSWFRRARLWWRRINRNSEILDRQRWYWGHRLRDDQLTDEAIAEGIAAAQKVAVACSMLPMMEQQARNAAQQQVMNSDLERAKRMNEQLRNQMNVETQKISKP